MSENLNRPSDSETIVEPFKYTDALIYLDQIRRKFECQPQVYKEFLEIVKQLKSLNIDAPGMISRVCNLFQGHPDLIVGFNTFLRPDYKIEVVTHDPSYHVSFAGGVIRYVVTSSIAPDPVLSTLPYQPPNTSSQGIQHNSTAEVSVRSVVIVTHPDRRAGIPGYVGNGRNVGGNINNVGSVGATNGRSVSPSTPALNSAFPTSNYDPIMGPSAFTHHSFTSPFVPNAFPSFQSNPVEFNHAVNYVNKIKNRFAFVDGQPNKYKQFLEILHTYQKQQRSLRKGLPPCSKHLTEREVYSQVANLFENDKDLLQGFGQFLPDTTNHTSVNFKPVTEQPPNKAVKVPNKERKYNPPPASIPPIRPLRSQKGYKRSSVVPLHPVTKKSKFSAAHKDINPPEAARYGTLHDYSFFDKVRSVIEDQETYENFLRGVCLFNEEVLSRQELLSFVKPYFVKSPELYAWLKDFVGLNPTDRSSTRIYDPLPPSFAKQDKLSEEQALEIDFLTCKSLGASYCALPKNHKSSPCSGKSTLCKEVLNDEWVSLPTLFKDSPFVTSRKTKYEEHIWQCEDERFELNVVIEANASTIEAFEAIARKMSLMTPDEFSTYELDEKLGGDSSTINQRTIKRLYGDLAVPVIEGLQKQPAITIPIVLKRLKTKDEEWRKSQEDFNIIWREKMKLYYLKSLDHQGITFKQSDVRILGSKCLISEIETIFDERHEACLDSESSSDPTPHMSLLYREQTVLDDACNLLLHHVRRQSSFQKDDKRKIKQLLKHFIPDLFNHTRMELSDDENDDGSHDEQDDRKSPTEYLQNGTRNGSKRNASKRGNAKVKKNKDEDRGTSNQDTANTHSTAIGEAQESRRTMAKRELRQSQTEGSRCRRHSGSHGRESRQAGYEGNDPHQGGSEGSDHQQTSDADVIKHESTLDDRPIRIIQVPHPDQDESYSLFYVNNSWYVFLRLHQILCERLTRMLETATKLLVNESKESQDPINCPAVVLRLRPINDVEIEDYYPTFLEMVRNLLDGNMEASSYEDTLREMFGIHAYIAYTMDKVVANAVRQLQTMVADDVCQKVLDFYQQAQKKGGAGGLCVTSNQRLAAEVAYQKQSEKAFSDKNCVKIIIYHKSCRMTMQLLEGESSDDDSELAKWSAYIENYTSKTETRMDIKVKDRIKRVFLTRNIRKWKKSRLDAYTSQQHPVEALRNIPDKVHKSSSGIPGRRSPDPDDHVTTAGERLSSVRTEGKTKLIMSRIKVDPVSPEEAEELEKQLLLNSKRRNASGSKDSGTSDDIDDRDPLSKLKLGTNEPVTPEEAAELELKAKRRAETTNLPISPYIIKENLQCKFNPHSYKMVFVVNSENFFYLKGALKTAKQNHKAVSKRLNEEFGKWHQEWLMKNVSGDQITRCEDWLISSKISDTRIMSQNDINEPPYRPFNRYVVVKK